MKAAICPSCGAPVSFRWSSAVQTTCEYCRSILVRHDVDLTRVGEVGDIPDDPSPLQIGTEGVYRGKSFQIIGRIVYEYENGNWNEWHLIFNDGVSGWLSDAMLEYAVSFHFVPPQPPPSAVLQTGTPFHWNNTTYILTSVTHAHYGGVQGELPFTYWDKSDVDFADLRTTDGRFATIDGSDTPPMVFLGEFVDFASLKLTNLRPVEGWS